MWLLALFACTPDLTGDWQGSLTCDDAEYDIVFDLDARGSGWEGDGDYEWACGDDDTCDVEFRVNIAPLDGLDVVLRMTECIMDYDEDEDDYVSCIEPEDATWDGKDTLNAGLDGSPCWMSVAR